MTTRADGSIDITIGKNTSNGKTIEHGVPGKNPVCWFLHPSKPRMRRRRQCRIRTMKKQRIVTVIRSIVLMLVVGLNTMLWQDVQAQSSWRGLVVAPEQRCSPYQADEYPYSQSVEDQIAAELGGVYGPYTGRWFASQSETDIEHIVARSEAHDSGLCAADSETRIRFGNDLLNLTLAAPSVNRYQKADHDAAEWLPNQNWCWFASRVIAVRQKYQLTIDQVEAEALDSVLAGCTSTAMVVFQQGSAPAIAAGASTETREVIAEWDDDGNGFITCAEARAHGIAPVRRGHPAYPFMRDADRDGVVCESGGGGRSPAQVTPPRVAPTQSGCGPYRNCTALRSDHPRGVPRGHCAYQRRMDRDNDGWACER